ncbi:MAG TPA: CBS domain-containing protein [Gaiellaceae bacterium]|nr:CBS domain-containing protein [Gaiellaceae bacterium]
MDIPLLNLSSVLNSRLVDRAGETIGRVDDLIVRLADGGYPPITGLKARIGHREVFVPADRVADVAPGKVKLAGEQVDLGKFERREGEVLLRHDLLGRRMINVVGARLVRADDLVLGRVEEWWRVVGIDTSFRSLVRRLMPRGLRRLSAVGPFLDWESVEPFVRHVPTARLRLGFGRLAKLHPAQLADLVEAASHEEGEEIIDAVRGDRELEADVFEELDPEHQIEFLRERSDEEAARILAAMEADDAADLLGDLDQERRDPLLRLLPWRQQRKIRTLMGYNPATAGGLMSPDFIALPESATVSEALEQLRQTDLPEETVTTILVGDNGLLRGVISVVMLLKHEPAAALADVASTPPLTLSPDDDLTEIAMHMADYDLTLAPVVDENGQVLGIVTVDDLLELMIPDDWRRRASALANE